MPTERPPATERTLDAPVLKFDLSELTRELQSERTWETGSRNAITLLKTPDLRVVLVSMHAAAEVSRQAADAEMVIHVLGGNVLVETDAAKHTLEAGQLLTLHAGVAHRLEALSPCSLLLTLVSEKPHGAE
jgi:quercetin dioxygenase-like cupin family protein